MVVKVIFDKLVEKVIVYDTGVEIFLRVSPYPHVGDKVESGQPNYKLSLTAHREEISPPVGKGGNRRKIDK